MPMITAVEWVRELCERMGWTRSDDATRRIAQRVLVAVRERMAGRSQ